MTERHADEYMPPGEVARLLSVSPKTVNRWASEGRLRCIKTLGGHRRFLRSDVERIRRELGYVEPDASE